MKLVHMPDDAKSLVGSVGTKHRSPSYPTFGLRAAVEKTQKFYVAQKKNSVHIEAAIKTIGYNTVNGSSLRAIAALINYGLVSEEGSGEGRKVKLTSLALEILLLPEDDIDRARAIATAAQKPKIYAEMLEMWPDDLPADAAIRKYLVFEKKFNEEAVQSLIQDFKDTYAFANLGNRGIMTSPEIETSGVSTGNNISSREDSQDEWRLPPMASGTVRTGDNGMTSPSQQDIRILTIPITKGRTALLNLPTELSEDDFSFLSAYLRLMKDALVTGKVSKSVSELTELEQTQD